MSSNQYTRERKEDKPVLAICYDFDKTLSPDDMQAQGYIQSVGYDVGEFWTESNGLASQNDMDQNLAYMLLMKKKAAGKLVFTRENLENYGAKVIALCEAQHNAIYLIMVVMRRTDVKTAPGEDSWRSCFT